MSEFLLEIGVEEIPAWMIDSALEQLRGKLGDLTTAEAWMFGTPRRLTAYIPNLPDNQPDTEQQLTGPPKKAPKQAAEAFAKKCGVEISQLETTTTPKGEYWTYLKKEKGQKTAALLESALPGIILGIHWPKTMYWTAKNGPRFIRPIRSLLAEQCEQRTDGPRFIRPIRSLLALFGGEVLNFEIAGVAAGNTTFGHRA